jgi:hypothetical protein
MYVGEVRDGKPNGQGTFVWGPSSEFSGDTYKGEWRKGKKNGQGVYTSSDGIVQQGVWENNNFKYAQNIRPVKIFTPLPKIRKQTTRFSSKFQKELETLQKQVIQLEHKNKKIIKSQRVQQKPMQLPEVIADKPKPVSPIVKLKQWWSSFTGSTDQTLGR